MVVVICSSHEDIVREIALGILLGTQFHHFILKVVEEAPPAIDKVHKLSPPHDV